MKELIEIQAELKAPKTQFNKFGNYAYRNAEDILEAVKPLLKKYGSYLTLSDEIQQVGERYYIKSTATIVTPSGTTSTTAFAREEETKKGMDGSQITGTSSSYARKYALNALFLIDDTKDSDTTNTHDKSDKNAKTGQKEVFDINTYKEQLSLLDSREAINEFWKQNKDLQSNIDFRQIFKNRLDEIK